MCAKTEAHPMSAASELADECRKAFDGDDVARKNIALRKAHDALRPSPDASGEREAPLRHAFRAADDEDWRFLFSCLPDGGRGRFWKEVIGEARDALAIMPGIEPGVARQHGDSPASINIYRT